MTMPLLLFIIYVKILPIDFHIFSRWLKPPTRLVLHVFPNAAFSQEPTNTLELTLSFSETLRWCVGCSPPKDCSTVHMLRFITLCQENRHWLLVITGYFYGIIHFVNGVIVISTYNWYNLGHNCRKR